MEFRIGNRGWFASGYSAFVFVSGVAVLERFLMVLMFDSLSQIDTCTLKLFMGPNKLLRLPPF